MFYQLLDGKTKNGNANLGETRLDDLAVGSGDLGLLTEATLTLGGLLAQDVAFKSHILTKKDTKRTRRLRAGGYADVTNMDAVRKMIPYK